MRARLGAYIGSSSVVAAVDPMSPKRLLLPLPLQCCVYMSSMHAGPAAAAAACLQRLRRGFAVVSGEDSHDDFKPKYKTEPASDVKTTIENDIKSYEVFIYMKVLLPIHTSAHTSVLNLPEPARPVLSACLPD